MHKNTKTKKNCNPYRMIAIISILMIIIFTKTTSSIALYSAKDILRDVRIKIKNKEYSEALSRINLIEGKEIIDAKSKDNIEFIHAYLNLKLKKYDYAIKLFNIELEKRDTLLSEYILYFLASAYSGKEEHLKALKILKDIKKKYKHTAIDKDITIALINENIRLERHDTAVALLNQFLKDYKNYKDTPGLLTLLAKGNYDLKQYKEAYSAYKRIYIHFPLDKTALNAFKEMSAIKGHVLNNDLKITLREKFTRAKKLMRSGAFNTAIKEFKGILKDVNDDDIKIDSSFYLGICYISKGLHKKGIAALKSIAYTYPRHKTVPKIYYKIARTYWNNGDVANSKKFGNKIIKGYPSTRWAARTFLLLGRISEEINDMKSAINYYKKVVGRFGRDAIAPKAMWRIGWVYFNNKDFKNAALYFNKTLSKYGYSDYSDNALYWQARSYQELNRQKRVKEILHKLTKMFPYSYYGRLAYNKLVSYTSKSEDLYSDKYIYKQFGYTLKDDSPFGPRNVTLHDQDILIKKKVERLVELGLSEYAEREVDLLSSGYNKKDLKSVIWINSLYIQTAAFKKYFNNLNNLLYYLSKGRGGEITPTFWMMYFPLGFWDKIIKYSQANNIDPFLITSLIRQESLFNNMAVSRTGAKGLMQLMPATAKMELKRLGIKKELNDFSLFDPSLNIRLGAAHFKGLIERFKGNIVLAIIAYNAGIRKAVEWKDRFNNLPADMFIEALPYPETRSFVKNVLRNLYAYRYLYAERF